MGDSVGDSVGEGRMGLRPLGAAEERFLGREGAELPRGGLTLGTYTEEPCPPTMSYFLPIPSTAAKGRIEGRGGWGGGPGQQATSRRLGVAETRLGKPAETSAQCCFIRSFQAGAPGGKQGGHRREALCGDTAWCSHLSRCSPPKLRCSLPAMRTR